MPKGKRAKAGEEKEHGGRIIVKVEGHPKFGTGWVKRSHLVLWEETGRAPDWTEKREVAHHRNGDKKDDRYENLEIITQTEHVRLHKPMKGKRHSKETRRKLSQAKIGNKNRSGIKHSAEAKDKISETMRSWYKSPEGQAKVDRQKVRQTSKGEYQ